MKKRTPYLFAFIIGLLMLFAIMPLSMEQAYADTASITVDGVKYETNNDGKTAKEEYRQDQVTELTTQTEKTHET